MIADLELEQLFLKPTSTILDALKVIDTYGSGGTKVALVVDASKKLLGVVGDGDIRRALLKHKDLNTKLHEIINNDFKYVDENMSRTHVLDMMKVHKLSQIPALDQYGAVVKLHLLHKIIQEEVLPNVAIIMAGGKGERLKPITEEIPKPMIRVAGKPILEHILMHLVGHGICNIYLSVNYKAEIIKEYFMDGKKYGCKISYLEECKPLGTVGSLSLLPPMSDDLLLMNGDLITQFDVKNLLQHHRKALNAITVGAREYVTKIPYGVIETMDDSIVDIKEKPEYYHLINAGVYVLSPDVIGYIPKDEVYYTTSLINVCFERNRKVGYHMLEEDWIDVGEHKELQKAKGGF